VAQGQGLLTIRARVVGTNATSNAALLGYSPPSVTTIVPLSGPSEGGTRLVLSGTDLGLSLVAAAAAVGCAVRNKVLLGTLPCDVVEVCVRVPGVSGGEREHGWAWRGFDMQARTRRTQTGMLWTCAGCLGEGPRFLSPLHERHHPPRCVACGPDFASVLLPSPVSPHDH
jgi:hypothetical protein